MVHAWVRQDARSNLQIVVRVALDRERHAPTKTVSRNQTWVWPNLYRCPKSSKFSTIEKARLSSITLINDLQLSRIPTLKMSHRKWDHLKHRIDKIILRTKGCWSLRKCSKTQSVPNKLSWTSRCSGGKKELMNKISFSAVLIKQRSSHPSEQISTQIVSSSRHPFLVLVARLITSATMMMTTRT